MVEKIKVKYLILGNGFIGKRFGSYLDDSVVSEIRVNSVEEVLGEIGKYNPEIVINCIGKTGKPNIDWCEDNKEETLYSNVIVAGMILKACQDKGVRMVHISSGCIYQGNNDGKGFSEDDEPNFFGSYYSRTKIIAEKMIKEYPVLILRIRMPMDSLDFSKNLLTKLLKYEKIINIPNSLTILSDFFRVSKFLMDNNKTGIFNIVNPGIELHDELLKIYNKYSKNKKEYQIVTQEELDIKAYRSNCILSIDKISALGIKLQNINEIQEDMVKKYVQDIES